jgi:HK97 family phage prohead protease
MEQRQNEYIITKFKTEVRAAEESGKKLVLRGYPILFNNPTKIYSFWYGEVTETILNTALDGTDLSNVYLLVGHNADNLLGRTGINMRIEKDETGLFFECELPNTQLARDWYNLVESGIVDGMSFAFTTSDEINETTKTRTITHINELFEITITPFPAYKEASVVAMREKEKTEAEQKQKEREEQERIAKESKEALAKKLKVLEEL